MEVVSIAKSVESKDLEHAVCTVFGTLLVFNSFGFDIGEDRIEACQWQNQMALSFSKEGLSIFYEY